VGDNMAQSDKSTLEFKSNIYPVTESSIRSDRKFLDAISDPFALRKMHSERITLNKLQRKQFEKSVHCSYADDGDYPWGTVLTDGGLHVVCRCKKRDCPFFYTECRPDIKREMDAKPSMIPDTAADVAEQETRKEDSQPHESISENSDVVATPLSDSQPELQIPDEIGPEEEMSSIPLGEEPYPEGWTKKYDPQQAAIVEAKCNARIYVNAGPGTGKTFTLIERLKYLMETEHVDPEEILVLSFTNAAVNVIQERLRAAANAGELHNSWQLIDVTTFDKFCTRVLMWIQQNKPELYKTNKKLGAMNYDERIQYACSIIKRSPDIIGACSHLLIDETQDLNSCRAELALTIIDELPSQCGITLMGDRCQSLYDYQIHGHQMSSEDFFDAITRRGDFEFRTLNKSYRTKAKLPFDLAPLRSKILDRDAEGARAVIESIADVFDKPEMTLRQQNIKGRQAASLGILVRTNAEALEVDDLLGKMGVRAHLERFEKQRFASRLFADIFRDYPNETITEDRFLKLALSTGLVDEDQAEGIWSELNGSHLVHQEGTRIEVADILDVLAGEEGVLPPLLCAHAEDGSNTYISTVHGAKGREFDSVWLMAEDMNGWAASKSLGLDEEKVAYVALSRARYQVALQSCDLGKASSGRNEDVDRCYKWSRGRVGRATKRLTHLEFVSSEDIDFSSCCSEPELQQLLSNGSLNGQEVCLVNPDLDCRRYQIVLKDRPDIVLGRTARSFGDAYYACCPPSRGDKPLPNAFDDLHIVETISCVGKKGLAPASAKVFGKRAIWYGFVISGFARVNDQFEH
jgi:DNA helicase-2/ATP-dependent DNA helicase PcrA